MMDNDKAIGKNSIQQMLFVQRLRKSEAHLIYPFQYNHDTQGFICVPVAAIIFYEYLYYRSYS